MPSQIKDWSLRTMGGKLVKIGAKVVSYTRYVTFQIGEVAAAKDLFCEIVERIRGLALVTKGSGAG